MEKSNLKPIAVTLGVIFAFLLAVSLGANAVDNPYQFIRSAKDKFIQGDPDGAIADYSQAIVLKSDYVGAHYYRGVAKSKLGDEQGARKDLARTKELRKDR